MKMVNLNLNKIILLIYLSLLINQCTLKSQDPKLFSQEVLQYNKLSSPIFNTVDSDLNLGFFVLDLINQNRFKLNSKEINLHLAAIDYSLHQSNLGETVTWYNSDRITSGEVRLIKVESKKTNNQCKYLQSNIILLGINKEEILRICEK